LDFLWKANIRPLREMIQSLEQSNPGMTRDLASSKLECALIARDFDAARAALAAADGDSFLSHDAIHFSRPFTEGLIAHMAGDDATARRQLVVARNTQVKLVQAQPDYAPSLCVLGVIDAVLGRKDDALREGRRAIELLPVTNDAINGPLMNAYFAIIAAWVNEKDLACTQLQTALSYPSGITYGELKLSPFWDPLRGNPQFEKIVASLAPK
jgi:serine/threonine-protein kinase